MNVDPETVKKFVDFCLRPDNIQDVAYGSRLVDVDDGTSFICPQWIRKSHRAKMARAFKQEFSDKVAKMPSRTWMYKVMDWIGKKDMVSLAGLDNTDVAGKEAMIATADLAVTVMNNLGAEMPPELIQQVVGMRKEMEECKSVLRQHLEDSMGKESNVSSHCLQHCLNSTDGFTCTHEHTECEMCVKPFAALALVDFMISKVRDVRQKQIFKRKHDLHCFIHGAHSAFSCSATHAGCNNRCNARKPPSYCSRLGNEVVGTVCAGAAISILCQSWPQLAPSLCD